MNIRTCLAWTLSGALLLTGGCALPFSPKAVSLRATDTFTEKGRLIQDFYTDKSAYRPGESVQFTLSLFNATQKEFNGTIAISCRKLNEPVKTFTKYVKLASQEKSSLTLTWDSPKEDFQGYLVEAVAKQGKTLVDQRNTAVDVSSSWGRYPRYGYVCDYPQMSQSQIDAVVNRLSKYHINGLQFYDWQDEHDKPLAGTVEKPAAEWQDIAKRDTYASTVKGYISALHQKNMMAANYDLMFGAYDDYQTKGEKAEWGLYTDEQHKEQKALKLPDTWESSINIMNPGNADWRNYLLTQEQKVFQVFDFDVFHVDTLGYQGDLYDYSGKTVNLASTYATFLQQAKNTLHKGIVMNAVNQYGAMEAGKCDVDFMYTEAWPTDFSDYASLQRVVDDNFTFSGNKKGCIVAAYMNYEEAGQNFNPNAVKLTDAVLFASGAGHLELGDTGMLSSEYFPNNKMMLSDSLASDLRSYYDFLTAYETILRAPGTRTDFSGKLEGAPVSDDGSAGTVWAFEANVGSIHTVQLINLLSRSGNDWRDDDGSCEAPKTLGNFTVQVKDGAKAKKVYLASPDLLGGSMLPLKFRQSGNTVEIQVPSLQYWDMLVIEH